MKTSATLLLAFCLPPALLSQTDSSAILSGKVTSSYNGRPLAGVMISVPAVKKFAVTDSTGSFSLSGLPAGKQTVLISYEGRGTEAYEFALKGGHTKKLTVILDVEAIDLAPVVVETRAAWGSRNLAGFYDRKKWYEGFARFFTREDIERLRPIRISDLLSRYGLFVRDGAPTRISRGRVCRVPVSVDGLPFWDFDFDNIAVQDLAGVEVYRDGPMGFPFGYPMLSLPSSMGRDAGPFESRGACGAILIWTR